MRKFDLNVEKVLEDWETADAVREIISNAIDEEILSGSAKIRIFKDAKGWHVRDFGRGLRHNHLTQNESQEKLKNRDKVIGKFGVGLKDALATLDRHRVKVFIRSKYGDVTLALSSKPGFTDVVTLHALIEEPTDMRFAGTEFILPDADHHLAWRTDSHPELHLRLPESLVVRAGDGRWKFQLASEFYLC